MSDIDGETGAAGDPEIADAATALLDRARTDFGIQASDLSELREKVDQRRHTEYGKAPGYEDSGVYVGLVNLGNDINREIERDNAVVGAKGLEETTSDEAPKESGGLRALAEEARAENDEAAGETVAPIDKKAPMSAEPVAAEAKAEQSGINIDVLDKMDEISVELRESRKHQLELLTGLDAIKTKQAEEKRRMEESLSSISRELEARQDELDQEVSRSKDLAEQFRDLSKKLCDAS